MKKVFNRLIELLDDNKLTKNMMLHLILDDPEIKNKDFLREKVFNRLLNYEKELLFRFIIFIFLKKNFFLDL